MNVRIISKKNFGFATSIILGIGVVVLMAVGSLSALYLTKINQDVRQQAATSPYSGSCYFGISTCPTGKKLDSSACDSNSCPSGSAICCVTSKVSDKPPAFHLLEDQHQLLLLPES